MIVKNEAEDLERALRSANEHVDEVVIVDTGSTDGTQEIAQKYAHVFEEIEWHGFSHARNYSMDLATGDRILILDADEWIAEGWENIKSAAEHPDFIAGTIQVINTTKQGPVRGESVIQPRVFRNVEEDGSRENLRYKFKVHNQIDDNLYEYGKRFLKEQGRRGIVVGIGAKIMHTGYDLTSEQVLEKYTPRVGVLREEVQRAKDEGKEREASYYEFQLALMLHMVYNTADAIPIWETLEFGNLNAFNRWYAYYIAARAFLAVDEYEKALKYCDGMFASMADDSGDPIPEEGTSYVVSGIVLCNYAADDLELYKQGIILMIEGYFKNLKPAYGVRCIMDPGHLRGDIAGALERINNGEALLLKTITDAGELYRELRRIQVELSEFDESLLDLVEQ